MSKELWSPGPMIGLIFLTLIISPAGVIIGFMNIKNENRKKQAITLVVLGIIDLIILTAWHFLGHSHH